MHAMVHGHFSWAKEKGNNISVKETTAEFDNRSDMNV